MSAGDFSPYRASSLPAEMMPVRRTVARCEVFPVALSINLIGRERESEPAVTNIADAVFSNSHLLPGVFRRC